MVGVLSLFFWSVALQIITCPAPSSEGACVCAKFSTCYILKVIINTSISTAAASHRPTPWDVKLNLQTGYEFWTVLYTDFGKIQYKVTHNLHRIFFSTDDLQKTFIYDRLLHTLSWSVYKEKTVFRTNVILL